MPQDYCEKVAFQGALGAYSDQACRDLFPHAQTIPCIAFRDCFELVSQGKADYAVIPIDNTLAGRVADVHHLLPNSGLSIVGEHFLPIRHCLLGVKGSDLSQITHVHSHIHALPQCRNFIRDNQLMDVVHADTAGAARDIAQQNDVTQSAIASSLAAEIYNLEIIAKDIQDDDRNKTRFIILSKTPLSQDRNDNQNLQEKNAITAFVFQVRNIPAALYKALGGFATNGVNMLKLESYVDHEFNAAQFYCEVTGRPHDDHVALALDELSFFAKDIKILGTFPKSPLRDRF